MKVVLDTNVLLSAFFTRGLCEAVLDACIASNSCTLVLSEFILAEFSRHAAGTFGAPSTEVAAALSFLRRHSLTVQPASMPPDACSDPDDLPVLGTAVAAQAHALVTGDAALQRLGSVQGVNIMAPRQFITSLV